MASSVVASEEDEECCPVCLEALSLRLQGEKPHIVPVCGHRLRESLHCPPRKLHPHRATCPHRGRCTLRTSIDPSSSRTDHECFQRVVSPSSERTAAPNVSGSLFQQTSLRRCQQGESQDELAGTVRSLSTGDEARGWGRGAGEEEQYVDCRGREAREFGKLTPCLHFRLHKEFAALSGLPQPSENASHKMRSVSKGTLDSHNPSHHDPTEDDELVHLPVLGPLLNPQMGGFQGIRGSVSTGSTGSTRIGRRGSAETMKGPGSSMSGSSRGSQVPSFDIVKPIITVRAEHAHVERSNDPEKKQHLTCMVTIEMPSRWHTPVPVVEGSPRVDDELRARDDAYATSPSSRAPSHSLKAGSDSYAHGRPTSPAPSSAYSVYAYGSTAASPSGDASANPFQSVVDDLQIRMADWKGHSPDEFGVLRLYDFIHVRKDTNTREFLVYVRPLQDRFRLL
jgi:hypothetical protein